MAKKPPQCLECIIVHEMMHPLERQHNERFRALMDTMNEAPLAHEDWEY